MRLYLLLLLLVSINLLALAEESVFSSILGDTLYQWKMSPEEQTMTIEENKTSELLKGKSTIALYFSASWCRPCQQFTPMLAKFYQEMNKKGKPFEVIWISQDRSTEEFAAYYQKMPWLALPVEAIQDKLQSLSATYKVKGIPHLVILDEDGTIITTDGRTMVAKDPYGLEFPWKPRTLTSLIPKPLQRLLKQQAKKYKEQGLNVLKGVASGLAPEKVFDFVSNKLIPAVSSVIVKAYNLVQDKAAAAA